MAIIQINYTTQALTDIRLQASELAPGKSSTNSMGFSFSNELRSMCTDVGHSSREGVPITLYLKI